MFLTTNRSVQFDDAFYSDLEEFAAERMNGRQIKNLMKMARLLANNVARDLDADQVRNVLEVTKGG